MLNFHFPPTLQVLRGRGLYIRIPAPCLALRRDKSEIHLGVVGMELRIKN
jgi:hypothetical protein